jgi:hypothetical protein
MLQRLANLIYWLCLVLAIVLTILGVATFVAVDQPLANNWFVLAVWSLIVAAIYVFACLVRFMSAWLRR